MDYLNLQAPDNKGKTTTIPITYKNGVETRREIFEIKDNFLTQKTINISDKNNKLTEQQIFSFTENATPVDNFYPQTQCWDSKKDEQKASKIELIKHYNAGKTVFIQDSTGINLSFFDNKGKELRRDFLTFGGDRTNKSLICNQSTIDFKNNTKFNISNMDSDADPNIEKISKQFNTLSGEKVSYDYESNLYDGTSNSNLSIGDFKVNREYKKLSPTEAISKVNNQEYHMNFDEDKITVTHNGKQTVIDLSKKVANNNEEIKNQIRKLSGDVLLQFNREVELVTKIDDGGEFDETTDTMTCENNIFTLLHETGHAVAITPAKDGSPVAGLSKDKELQKIFIEEVENFKKIMPSKMQELEEYFIDFKSTDNLEFLKKINEFIGETYLIIQAGGLPQMDLQNIPSARVFNRQHLLMQFFPKSMAYVGQKTLEYEQIIDSNNPRTNNEKT